MTPLRPFGCRFVCVVKIYTRKGDDGSTGLLYGGRASKTDLCIELAGLVDEAQAVLGLARAEAAQRSELSSLLVTLQRDLWVLMAEVATSIDKRDKLVKDKTAVSEAMVASLEGHIDRLETTYDAPSGFVLPGQDRLSALLDLARVTVRRAERAAWRTPTEGSFVGPYLNRLSDLCWIMARSEEHHHLLTAESSELA